MHNSVENPLKRQSGAISMPLVIAIIAVLAVVLAYFLFLRPAPEQDVPGSAPPTTAKERGDTARAEITELKQDKAIPDLATAYAQAQEHLAAGRLADAQLLYFFAAKGGHAPAAFDLATMYDPTYFKSDTSVMNKADPFQAYKWYKQALDSGNAQARARIAGLKKWAMEAADEGDAEAERLLMTMGTN